MFRVGRGRRDAKKKAPWWGETNVPVWSGKARRLKKKPPLRKQRWQKFQEIWFTNKELLRQLSAAESQRHLRMCNPSVHRKRTEEARC